MRRIVDRSARLVPARARCVPAGPVVVPGLRALPALPALAAALVLAVSAVVAALAVLPVAPALADAPAAAAPPPAAAAAPSPEATAHAFAAAVIEKDAAAARALAAPKMVAAMTDATLDQLYSEIATKCGAVRGVGEARHDDTIGGYRRYRVPVEGDRQELDLQVVIDQAGQVAGLGFLPHAAAPAPADSAALARPREVEVTVGAGDDALPGTLALPAGDGPFPAVVLVHGSGANDRDETILGNRPFRDLAWGLAAQGVATLRYDKRSFAKPQTLLRHGAALTVRAEVVDDAVAAVAVLRARPEIAADRVFVLGHSLGGMLAPRIAGEAKAAGVIIMAGAARPLPEMMLEQTRYLAALDDTVTGEEQANLDDLQAKVTALREAQKDSLGSQLWLLGAPVGYFTDLEAYDGPATAAALGRPVLVLQGMRDYQVTLKDLGRWRQALQDSPWACMKVYGDLDHLMRPGEGKSGPDDYAKSRPVSPMVIGDVAKFVLGGGCPAAGGQGGRRPVPGGTGG